MKRDRAKTVVDAVAAADAVVLAAIDLAAVDAVVVADAAVIAVAVDEVSPAVAADMGRLAGKFD
jgi:hypothetical protein